MVFIRTKTNRYVAKDGSARAYTYGLLVRSCRSPGGGPPIQQVIKYLGRAYDKERVLANAQKYVEEFEDLSKRTLAFAKKHGRVPVKEFYVRFVEEYLRHSGFTKQGGKMVRRDIIIDARGFSVVSHGAKARVRVGSDLVDSAFLKEVYARLRSIRSNSRE